MRFQAVATAAGRGGGFDSIYVGGEDSDADDEGGRVSLVWLGGGGYNYLVRDPSPNTSYTIDARIRHESVTSGTGRVDVSVNGHEVFRGLQFEYMPLSLLNLYNFFPGNIGDWRMETSRSGMRKLGQTRSRRKETKLNSVYFVVQHT